MTRTERLRGPTSPQRQPRRGPRLAAATVAALLAAGLVAGAPHLSAVPAATDISPGVVQILHLKRAGVASDVWVYRPRVRDSAKLPVVYFLHGLPGEPGDVFRYAHVAQIVDSYIAHGGTPVVIASPDGNSPIHADSEWGNASDGSDELESFILNTVVPAVEGAHRRDAAHRAIAGFSMGGFGAMNIALRHPG